MHTAPSQISEPSSHVDMNLIEREQIVSKLGDEVPQKKLKKRYSLKANWAGNKLKTKVGGGFSIELRQWCWSLLFIILRFRIAWSDWQNMGGVGDKDTRCCEWSECLSYAGHAFDHYPSDITIWKRKRSLKDTVGELSGYHNQPVWHSSHKNIGSV